MPDYNIQKMPFSDVRILLDWAASEGWNPGLDDALAFYKADQDGFFVLKIEDSPIVGISVVKHDPHHAFLGLYLCKPDFRRQGWGWKLWQHAMQSSENRTVALDGVVEQQSNYQKSGFEFAWNNYRYLARLSGQPNRGTSGKYLLKKATRTNIPALVEFDYLVGGIQRKNFLNEWLTDTQSRSTLICDVNGGGVQGMGTIRQCIDGFKIGPLYARDAEMADALLRALCATVGTNSAIVDVPECNKDAMNWIRQYAESPIFATARMYKGLPPETGLNQVYGIATLELG